MNATDALTALFDHLEAERGHLVELCAVLEDEAKALQGMALDDLIALGRRKQRIGEAHAHLARKRGARMEAVAPGAGGLSALIETLPAPDGVRLGALRDTLQGLLEQATRQNAWNRTFSETGKALIDATLRVLGARHAGPSATYGGNGRVAVGERRTRIDRRV